MRVHENTDMKLRMNWKRGAQLIAILACALTLKLYYSGASVNQLRWILAPTTTIVAFVTGLTFEFESHAGYITSDRSFVIAASCAGVNFLITAFLMLSLRQLWQNRSIRIPWTLIPKALALAYLATLVANTVRISTALRLREMPLETAWLSPNQLHRFEGIFIYFGFLLLLFVVSERLSPYVREGASTAPVASVSGNTGGLFGRSIFPLLIYYATALGIPLANGAYRQGIDFWEHSAFVMLTPLLLIFPIAAFRLYRLWPRQPIAAQYSIRALPKDRFKRNEVGTTSR
jgi:exosortase K